MCSFKFVVQLLAHLDCCNLSTFDPDCVIALTKLDCHALTADDLIRGLSSARGIAWLSCVLSCIRGDKAGWADHIVEALTS